MKGSNHRSEEELVLYIKQVSCFLGPRGRYIHIFFYFFATIVFIILIYYIPSSCYLIPFYIKLEISLAQKDQQIAEKDKRINTLEEEVAIHPVFHNKHSTPSSTISKLSSHNSSSKQSITSPHPVSDESGESEQTLSYSMSNITGESLSHISKVNSSDTDEIVDNGRWNIPWDLNSVEEDKAGNRRISNGNALRDIEFVSIEKECRVRRDGVGTTVLARPVPVRRQTLGASPPLRNKGVKNKENVSPKKRESTGSIRSLREIR